MKGDGKVYKVKSKSGDVWICRIVVDDKDIRKRFANKAQAEAHLKALKEAARKAAAAKEFGIPLVNQECRTFKEAAEDFLLSRRSRKPNTRYRYKNTVKKHLLPEFCSKRLSDITDLHIERFQEELLRTHKPSSVAVIMRPLRTILIKAHKRREILFNPAADVACPPKSKVKIQPFEEDELAAIFTKVDSRFRSFFLFWMLTGARPNEIAALKWSDVNKKREIISVQRGISMGEEGSPKTASSIRDLPITEEIAAVLANQEANPLASIGGYIFVTDKGKRVDYRNLYRTWKAACLAAEVRYRRPYQLRHTFTTRSLQFGCSVNYISELLGHANISTLMRHYQSYIEGFRKQDRDRLSNALLGSHHGKILATIPMQDWKPQPVQPSDKKTHSGGECVMPLFGRRAGAARGKEHPCSLSLENLRYVTDDAGWKCLFPAG